MMKIFCESGQLLWLVFSGGPVLPRRQRQCHLNCGNVAVILYRGVWQGAEAGERGVRNAGSWHWLTVILGVLPSETSRCWKVKKKSTRKLLSQGKSISTLKRSVFNSILLFLIFSAFTSKELRYYPESSSCILQGDFQGDLQGDVSLPHY